MGPTLIGTCQIKVRVKKFMGCFLFKTVTGLGLPLRGHCHSLCHEVVVSFSIVKEVF
jgi:hypothetical protein